MNEAAAAAKRVERDALEREQLAARSPVNTVPQSLLERLAQVQPSTLAVTS